MGNLARPHLKKTKGIQTAFDKERKNQEERERTLRRGAAREGPKLSLSYTCRMWYLELLGLSRKKPGTDQEK